MKRYLTRNEAEIRSVGLHAWCITFEGWRNLKTNGTLRGPNIHWCNSEREAVEVLAALYKKHGVR